MCTVCNTDLFSTIVNFGDKLNEKDYQKFAIIFTWLPYYRALRNAESAELFLCLGTSLKVKPAAELVAQCENIVICNLQQYATKFFKSCRTPIDQDASLIVRAKSDTIMELLAKELGLPIPTFVFSLRIQFCIARIGANKPYFGLNASVPDSSIQKYVQSIEFSVSKDLQRTLNKKNHFRTTFLLPTSSPMPKCDLLLTFQPALQCAATTTIVQHDFEHGNVEYVLSCALGSPQWSCNNTAM